MYEPRHGQWVKFRAADPVAGAHAAADGMIVGVYQRAREAPIVSSSTQDGPPARPVLIPAHVAAVRPDGLNLMRLSDDGHGVVKVAFDPNDCPDLAPATVPDDLPRCARTEHLFQDAERRPPEGDPL